MDKKKRHRIIKIEGVRFKLYFEKDGEYLVLPDFEKNPQYTKKGYPYQLLIHDDCPYCSPPGEVCGGCKYFKSYPDSPIGVCKNERLRQKQKIGVMDRAQKKEI